MRRLGIRIRLIQMDLCSVFGSAHATPTSDTEGGDL